MQRHPQVLSGPAVDVLSEANTGFQLETACHHAAVGHRLLCKEPAPQIARRIAQRPYLKQHRIRPTALIPVVVYACSFPASEHYSPALVGREHTLERPQLLAGLDFGVE